MNKFDELHGQAKADLEHKLLSYATTLASGGVNDYASYRHSCGRIAGLKEALKTLDQHHAKLKDAFETKNITKESY